MSNAPSTPAPERLRTLISGYMVTQSLAIVARLGVADELAGGPLTAEELAARTGADADALYRVLRALAGLGVFEQTERTFALNELSTLLREDARPSLRHLAILFGGELYTAWGSAMESLKTGKPAFATVFGCDHFSYIGERPEALETFTKAMAGTARGRVEALMAVDWTGTRRVVDVGGGDGTLLLELLARQPSLEGAVFDLPEVAPSAKAKIASAGLEGRCSFHAGSFLRDAPPAADTYVLARVLHDWSDEDAATILRHVRSTAAPGARVIVIDEVLRSGSDFESGKLLDLQMLVILGGRERTEEEWRALLAQTGFEVSAIRREPRWSFVEARAV